MKRLEVSTEAEGGGVETAVSKANDRSADVDTEPTTPLALAKATDSDIDPTTSDSNDNFVATNHRQQLHMVSHGNALNAKFSCENDDFEIAGFKFSAGDSARPYLCHMFCNDQGLHRHIDYSINVDAMHFCEQEAVSILTGRSCPKPNKPKDYITQAEYGEEWI
ncbi:hypothetical protein BJ742DRAFT_873331 [Cladochytrium replicatum]|nr:hypothetical protein BJ742DRAFT_873331 [Cladochytrium replicatum]